MAGIEADPEILPDTGQEIEEALHRPLDARERAVAGVALLFDKARLARKAVDIERLIAFAAIVKEVRRLLVIARQRDQPAAAEIIFGAGVERPLALRLKCRIAGKDDLRRGARLGEKEGACVLAARTLAIRRIRQAKVQCRREMEQG